MKDFIVVTALCLVAAVVVDRVWFGGKYTGEVAQELGLSWSRLSSDAGSTVKP